MGQLIIFLASQGLGKNMRLDDDRIMVPFSWFVALFGSIVISVGTASFWVRRVDDRLARMEQYMGLSPLVETTLIENAKAGE